MKKMIKPIMSLCMAAVVSLLAGCAMTPPTQTLPELTYAHLQPILLRAGTLDIVSDYKPTIAAPNVEHKMATSPDKALRRWAADRLDLAGGPDYARLSIIDASVVETRLATQGGLKGAFISEQAERYQANLKVKLEIIGPGNVPRGFATTEASRSITVSEDASLNQREQVWFNLVEALMNDFNSEFEKNIAAYLGK